MPVRVLLLTQWFDPEPTFKGIVFARELVLQGFQVEVVTGFPNYPGGKVYPGYRIQMIQREVIDGIDVTRLPLYPNHDQSAIKRILNYLSFGISALYYCLFVAQRADVIYAYHPPLTVGITASLVRFFRRIPVVYDIQDMWPDTLRATGMIKSVRILNAVELVCQWVYRRVDHLVVLSPGFKKLLTARGVPESKIDVIYNWADEVALGSPQGVLSESFPGVDRFRILFAGNIGRAQALDTVLDAACLLRTRNPTICFILLGGGLEVDRLKLKVNELGLSNVVFLPPVPMAEVGTQLNAADALLVHLRKDPLFRITIPSKTQAYLSVGKPLLMAVDGDAADLVRRAEAGVIAESENSESLAIAAEQLAELSAAERNAMGARALSFYRQNLALSAGVGQFAKILRRLGNGQ